MDALTILDDSTSVDVNADNYWVIYAKGIEAMFLVTKLVKEWQKRCPSATAEDRVAILDVARDHPTYYLKKTVFSVDDIARITGGKPEKLAKMRQITVFLTPDPSMPKPTVPTWGTA